MACIFTRGKTHTWWIKYYVDGKQVYHSLNTTDRRVAERAKKMIEGDEVRGELFAPSRTPLPELLEDYCRFMTTARTRKSFSTEVSILRIFFGPICSALELGIRSPHCNGYRAGERLPDTLAHRHVKAERLEEITGAMIEDFITCRMREDGISPRTANRTREVLHKLFNYAAKKWNFVAPDRRHPNPAAIVERRAEPPRVVRFLSAEQITAQLAVLSRDPLLQAMVATYIYAGLRREEALWLTRDNVDLERRLIFVQAKTVGNESWQPKTKRNRVVPISRTLAEILAAFCASERRRWYFPARGGRRWDPDNFSRALRNTNRKRGLPWSCLDFRHTFGSHLAQNGISLYKIAVMMGNSPEICRRHYAMLQPERMHDEVEFEPKAAPPPPTDDLLRQVLAKLDELPAAGQAPLRIAQ